MSSLRSRLRYTGSNAAGDSDQGSPSRTSSLFQQFVSFLGPDDAAAGVASSNKAPFSQEENGSGIESDERRTDEEFLSFVIDSGEDSSTAVGNSPFLRNRSEQIINSPGRPTASMAALISHRLPLLAASFSRESLDLGSDRDTSREGSEEPSANIAHSLERPNRRHHRFANRDKRRSERERSKSIERSGVAAVAASTAEETPIKSKNENVEVGLKSLHGTSNKGSRSNTASPSRLGPHRRIAAWAREIVDDFHAIEEAHKGKRLTESGDDPGETLAIKRLKSNIMRFGRATSAISSLTDSLQSLRQWEWPLATCIFILVMSYAIWNGLFLSLLVVSFLIQLTINYFTSQGNWENQQTENDDEQQQQTDGTKSSSSSSSSSSVADRLTFVLQVARKVQNQLGSVCDAFEKIKNLLMWRHEESRRLYTLLWLVLPVTLYVPAAQLSAIVGFYFLMKLFVVDAVFQRFPSLREKYDTSSLIWDTLPTDADLLNRTRDIKLQQQQQGSTNKTCAGSETSRLMTFGELFNLQTDETPLPDWQNGVRCTLVNRDKSLTSSLKSGRLFLTANYLCFERSKTQAGKNIVIPLERIRGIEKGNQYAWIPGGGMIIEVFVQGLDRAYTFGALMNRDEIVVAIRQAAEKLTGCIWPGDKSPTP